MRAEAWNQGRPGGRARLPLDFAGAITIYRPV